MYISDKPCFVMSTERSMSEEISHKIEMPPQKLRFIPLIKIYFVFDSLRNEQFYYLYAQIAYYQYLIYRTDVKNKIDVYIKKIFHDIEYLIKSWNTYS
ncbi:hypothetical protein GCM10022397_36680 [Flavivirga jejuensis]